MHKVNLRSSFISSIIERAERRCKGDPFYFLCRSFVIATSRIYGAKILTGDHEFKNLKGIVEIEWI
jgi:hypothetical protein